MGFYLQRPFLNIFDDWVLLVLVATGLDHGVKFVLCQVASFLFYQVQCAVLLSSNLLLEIVMVAKLCLCAFGLQRSHLSPIQLDRLLALLSLQKSGKILSSFREELRRTCWRKQALIWAKAVTRRIQRKTFTFPHHAIKCRIGHDLLSGAFLWAHTIAESADWIGIQFKLIGFNAVEHLHFWFTEKAVVDLDLHRG